MIFLRGDLQFLSVHYAMMQNKYIFMLCSHSGYV